MVTPVATFTIEHTRCLDPAGTAVAPLPAFASDPAELVRMYRAMVLARSFDAKAIALQRTGRLGTFASALGQEAVSIGTASAMAPDDVLVPSFREHGAQIWRGVTLLELLLYWGGDERGSDFKGPRQDFPISVPVGSHPPHAAGIALAMKLRRQKRAAVSIFGDGATSKGDVAEALNFAGVWTLPAVFVVSNNRWAISIPVARQTAAQTLAQKAIAAGIAGEQVDGNDAVAVRMVVARALEKARGGGGPTLVEALTYRLGDHTTSDDASRYRDDAEVSRHWPEEPVARLRAHLVARGAWTAGDEDALLRDCASEVDAAAAEYLATPAQDPDTMFAFTYEKPPRDLEDQRRAARSPEEPQ